MTTLNFGSTVTLAQAAQLAMSVTGNVFFFEGEPGIGKTSIVKAFEREYGDTREYVIFNAVNADLGDIAMPMPNRETGETEYYPNAVFKLRSGKPLVLLIDEYTKAPQSIQNVLHTTFEVYKPRLGDIPMPEGSIVIITGNLSSDGVGDNIKGHTLNRITRVRISKPTAEEWLMWAAENDIDPVMMAWVNQYPHCMASYTDDAQKDNPYIYNPRKPQVSYFSPRSAERGSNIIKARHLFDTDSLICALAGTIGESAARDMQAFIEFQDQLPKRAEIIKDPLHCRLPEGAGATAVMTYNMLTSIDKSCVDAYMDYAERLAPEWQATLCISIAKTAAKQAIAFSNQKFAAWVAKNEDIL
jgi:hypothetical protein